MENEHVEYDDNQYYEPLIHYNYGKFNYDDISGFFIEEFILINLTEIKKIEFDIKKLDK